MSRDPSALNADAQSQENPLRFSLDMIEIPIPCAVPWDSMSGDDRVRHCERCNQNVYQLKEMSQAEAVELIREHEGHLCVRLHRRPDGTVVTKRCAVVRYASAAWGWACFAILGLLSLVYAVRTAKPEQQEQFKCIGGAIRVSDGPNCSPSRSSLLTSPAAPSQPSPTPASQATPNPGSETNGNQIAQSAQVKK